MTLESVQRALPEDAALVEIVQLRGFNPVRAGTDDVWHPDRYAALVLRASEDPRWFDLGPAAAIDAAGERLRRLLRNRASPAADVEQAAAELHALLVAPLEPALASARHLVVSPEGKLTMVPFGVLRDAAGQTLASRYVVSYAAAGRELQSPPPPAPGSRRVVVIAAPDYEADAPAGGAAPAAAPFADRAGFAPLAGALAESEEIAALLEDATVLTGSAATVDAVRAVSGPAVLHIATHGFFSPIDEPEVRRSLDLLPIGDGVVLEQRYQTPVANPMFFSGIALAGADRRPPGTSAGLLTAQQLAGLDLRGTQLVVLSACETGLGTVERGSEFTGMRRALAIAGAATQVTTLWRVDDEATRVLMRHFYGLLLDGLGRAEALARAQERVAGDPDRPRSAPPVLLGGLRPLRRLDAHGRRAGPAPVVSDALRAQVQQLRRQAAEAAARGDAAAAQRACDALLSLDDQALAGGDPAITRDMLDGAATLVDVGDLARAGALLVKGIHVLAGSARATQADLIVPLNNLLAVYDRAGDAAGRNQAAAAIGAIAERLEGPLPGSAATVLIQLGGMYERGGNHVAALTMYRPVHASMLAQPDVPPGTLLAWLLAYARALIAGGQPDNGFAVGRQALDVAERALELDPAERLEAFAVVATAASRQDAAPAAQEALERGAALAEALQGGATSDRARLATLAGVIYHNLACSTWARGAASSTRGRRRSCSARSP